tara:strand:+ start:150 stop:455 length:306 start_codon:yes stop_codon:yes gene_type:complete
MLSEKENCPRWMGMYGARATVEEVAKILSFSVYDVRVLTRRGLLKPLGKPLAKSVKFYATREIMEKVMDVKWLNKATAACQRDHATRVNGKALNAGDCAKN